jgi:hypothetical protein
MSPPVTYRPAYIGLFASLVLAVTCNAYLDIQYGGFGIEVLVWATVYFFTLRVAWKQGGQVDEIGRQRQKVWLGVALLATVLLFLPMWGLPRGGLYALAAMQASMNCVTVDRRRFMMALMVSAVMVMFATVHWRADWTMMFYLVPYLFAVVFTLVAEQVSRRVREVQADGLGQSMSGGQGASIIAATATLLAVALVLFALTPQVTWVSLKWKYGQLSNIGILHGTEKGADGGILEPGGAGGGKEPAKRAAGADGRAPGGDQDLAHGDANGPSGDGYRESVGQSFGWPTPQEMRAACKREGMPVWQATTISKLADVTEQLEKAVQPLTVKVQVVTRLVIHWLEVNLLSLMRGLMMLVLLLLLGAAYVLLRELQLGLWLRVQVDFLRFGLLGLHAQGNAGVLQIYDATERLFLLNRVERERRLNVREYLALLRRVKGALGNEATEMIELFERARYGNSSAGSGDLRRMRHLYRYVRQRV